MLRRSPIAIAAASIAGLGLFGAGPALANNGPDEATQVHWGEVLPIDAESIEKPATALLEVDPQLLNSRTQEPSGMEGDALGEWPLAEDQTPAEASTRTPRTVAQPRMERAPVRPSARSTPKPLPPQAASGPVGNDTLAGLLMPWEGQADDGNTNTLDPAKAEPAVRAAADRSPGETWPEQPPRQTTAPSHSERVLQQLATTLDAAAETRSPTPKPPAPSQVDRVLETLAAVLMPVDIQLGLAETQANERSQPTKPMTPHADATRPPSPGHGESVTAVHTPETQHASPADTSPVTALHFNDRPNASDADAAPSAEPTSKRPSTVFATAPVDPSRLDTMRGGFITNDGLKVSFGIERAVYINGNLVTTTTLNVSELGKMSGGAAPASTISSPAAQGTLAVIQNGAGNMTVSNAGASAIGTVIQNNLNDQKIQTLTVINAVVNSLQVVRSMNLQQSMRNAVIDSLRR